MRAMPHWHRPQHAPRTTAAAAAAETPRETIEATFRGFGGRDDVGLILVSAPIADAIRPVIVAHQAAHKIPMVIEIPSKDGPADAGSNECVASQQSHCGSP